jgi:hypothetical protein
MLRTTLAVLMMLASLALPGVSDARKIPLPAEAEASLRVTGEVSIRADGSVASYRLDPQRALDAPLQAYLDGAISQWKFQPVKVNGQPVAATVPMSLRLVAKRNQGKDYTVRIASTYFRSSQQSGEVTPGKMDPPDYPEVALQARATGIVYLLARFGADGHLLDVDAEQVNLGIYSHNKIVMNALRKAFADAAIHAARDWTVNLRANPGQTAPAEPELVRIPVEFRLHGQPAGGWEVYVPGARKPIPWAGKLQRSAGSPDALPAAGIYPLEQGAELLTPLAS